jgi:integrase
MFIKSKIYKLKSNRYQVSFYNPATRKRERRKFPFKTQAEAFNDDLNNRFLFTGYYSSADSVEVWMKRCLELSPKPFIKRQGLPLFQGFMKSFSHLPVMSIDKAVLTEWIKQFQQVRGLSVKTIPNIKSAINQFFQFIVESQALSVNPMENVKYIEGLPPKERTVLTETEIIDLLQKIKELSPDLVYPVVFLMAYTGARLGEIQKLLWMDVHFDLGAIQLIGTKNGEDRLIHVSDEVLDYLKTLPRISEFVVNSQYQKAWTRGQYRKQFNKIRHKVRFKKYWCNHALRHSFATNYLKNCGDMLKLQKILGHKTLSMTVDLYGQLEAADILDISPFNF